MHSHPLLVDIASRNFFFVKRDTAEDTSSVQEKEKAHLPKWPRRDAAEWMVFFRGGVLVNWISTGTLRGLIVNWLLPVLPYTSWNFLLPSMVLTTLSAMPGVRSPFMAVCPPTDAHATRNAQRAAAAFKETLLCAPADMGFPPWLTKPLRMYPCRKPFPRSYAQSLTCFVQIVPPQHYCVAFLQNGTAHGDEHVLNFGSQPLQNCTDTIPRCFCPHKRYIQH